MSIQSNDSQVDQVLLPSVRDLGDFQVRRALPSAHRRMVGPFIFLDSFGPAVFREGVGVDTRPHPHIGLATLTYLIEGEMDHRDSEGYVQMIRPGEVNVMTAGRGIVHSERSGPDFRAREDRMFGFQAWLALPLAFEETDPGFQHVGADAIPVLDDRGAHVRLLAGRFGGVTSPTPIFSDTIHWQRADGDVVTTFKTYHGTHLGDFLGVPATGKTVSFETVDAMRVVDGKITDHWGVANLYSVLQQLGVITPLAK